MGNLMRRLNRLRQRGAQAVYTELRPNWHLLKETLHSAFRDRFLMLDSPEKRAVVIGSSEELAHCLGIRRAHLRLLDFPQFTMENLALLSDSCDFLIADRVLHRCENIRDAARETLRVLRPGGWFVHTTSILDQTIGVPFQPARFRPRSLSHLFGGATEISTGPSTASFSLASWIVGRKATDAPTTAPTVATRKARRRWYAPPARLPSTRFGVVAMARNEAPYLLEWIAHYRLLGFSSITIYDNESNDASWRILAPLAKAGIINAIHWRNPPGQNKQRSAYNDARVRLCNSLDWCLFVDLDEFLVLKEGATLEDLRPQDPSVSAVAIPWRIFGSSGQRHRGTELTIERFQLAAAKNGHAPKSMVRLRDVQWMKIHWPILSNGRMIDISGKEFDPNKRTPNTFDDVDGIARIHHYFGRSWEEFECKRARGRGGSKRIRPASIFDELDLNEMVVNDASRYVEATKKDVQRLLRIVKG
ncbi:glycosyltransferase family 2 protein [Dongia deserti]|uniref:glycosyltransferase family 2 protein n=1 Tax=Dongia deserti TaxID=2268030 RepID=UPI000E64C061|nr:glycosyltransferase family 2 protein [Dongia deserti]